MLHTPVELVAAATRMLGRGSPRRSDDSAAWRRPQFCPGRWPDRQILVACTYGMVLLPALMTPIMEQNRATEPFFWVLQAACVAFKCLNATPDSVVSPKHASMCCLRDFVTSIPPWKRNSSRQKSGKSMNMRVCEQIKKIPRQLILATTQPRQMGTSLQQRFAV